MSDVPTPGLHAADPVSCPCVCVLVRSRFTGPTAHSDRLHTAPWSSATSHLPQLLTLTLHTHSPGVKARDLLHLLLLFSFHRVRRWTFSAFTPSCCRWWWTRSVPFKLFLFRGETEQFRWIEMYRAARPRAACGSLFQRNRCSFPPFLSFFSPSKWSAMHHHYNVLYNPPLHHATQCDITKMPPPSSSYINHVLAEMLRRLHGPAVGEQEDQRCVSLFPPSPDLTSCRPSPTPMPSFFIPSPWLM